MDTGPYIKQKTISQKEVCNYCQYCRSHVVYKRKSNDVLSAECNHPKVADFCPSSSFGRSFSNHLDHDDTDVFTPYWCPVKMEASNYSEWINEIKALAHLKLTVVDVAAHKDVLIFLFKEHKTPESALAEYQDFQKRYIAIQKAQTTES